MEGAVGELLRREGLYSSHLTEWRRQRESGEFAALAPKKRGRKPRKNPLADELARLLWGHVTPNYTQRKVNIAERMGQVPVGTILRPAFLVLVTAEPATSY